MVEADAPCPCWSQHVTSSLVNKLVYKDECATCFNTPTHDHGLSVCLKTLVGFCADPEKNCVQRQFEKTGNPLYLNIKMTPVVQKDENGNIVVEKVNKLAIGMEGGIDANVGKYDTTTTVVCLHC